MSLEELREKNKRMTVQRALELFLANGVEQTTIRDIARASDVTERSVYRYYETKADLVLDSTFLFWDLFSEQAKEKWEKRMSPGTKGIDQIRIILMTYIDIYMEHPGYIRYIAGAERFLYDEGVSLEVRKRPPGRFESTNNPLVCAIRTGLSDGSVSRDVDVELLYYNAYDAIQGVMQRDAIGATDCDIDCFRRMASLCEMFVNAFRGTI